MNPIPDEIVKILIVDDEKNTADALKLQIEQSIDQVYVQVQTDFETALGLIRPQSFDVIVLDIFQGNIVDQDRAGQELWKLVLNEKFMPVIIYTAGECDVTPEFPADNPIFKCFQKSEGNLVAIASHLAMLKPYMLELREVHKEFSESIKRVLLESSRFLWIAESSETQRPRRILRAARRRLAAKMDLETLSTNEKMQHWEQYVIPPLGDSLLTGDIIHERESDAQDPNTYRLVLTPSCDLDPHGAAPNVSKILVAKCKQYDEFVKATGISINNDLTETKRKNARKSLSTQLTQSHVGGYIFLPEFKSVLPSMAACLRDLELIPIDQIIPTGGDVVSQFVRVVSIDSPFREQIAWSYLQVAARPGLPDRDTDQCIDENFAALRLAAAPQ
jgi:CheY-like chemotaxis protein